MGLSCGWELQLAYWGPEFVGAGPYRLREWAKSSHAIFVANGDYVLGRPRIDEIEVKFIPDPNPLEANILADTVQVTLDKSISIEQAIQVRDQWRGPAACRKSGGALPLSSRARAIRPGRCMVTTSGFAPMVDSARESGGEP